MDDALKEPLYDALLAEEADLVMHVMAVSNQHSPAHTRRDRRGFGASPSAAIGRGITEGSAKHLRVGNPALPHLRRGIRPRWTPRRGLPADMHR